MTQSEAAEFVSSLRRTMCALQALPMPTIAVVEGHALGGGAELALAADLRVADTRAAFAFPEARLGIIPGAGGSQRLPRLIGASAAKVRARAGTRAQACVHRRHPPTHLLCCCAAAAVLHCTQ
jgi:methylglutaconyl-CoA hydratase